MADNKVIQERMLNNIDDSNDTSVGSFLYDATKPVSVELEQLDNKLEELKNNMDLFNKSGNDLDVFINQRSRVMRKESTKATGKVTIEGSAGTKINIGILVSTETSDYKVLENAIISSTGIVDVLVECTNWGSSGNAPSMQINQFPVTIKGLTKVYNKEPLTNGFDTEEDDSFRDRYLEFIRLPITSGNKNHYRFWAKEVIGVGEAKVKSLWNGDNTVKVIISNSNGEVAGKELVKSVQEYIDPESKGLGEGEAPIGAFCTVVSVDGAKINISSDITIKSDADEEYIENKFRELVDKYFKFISFKESRIYLAQIECILFNVPGVIDRNNVLLNGKSDNIDLKDAEIPILNEVKLNATRE